MVRHEKKTKKNERYSRKRDTSILRVHWNHFGEIDPTIGEWKSHDAILR